MAWTAPRTWVTSETVTAAIMNTHVRDNLLETAPAKVTTAGDIVYATAANTLARRAVGTRAELLVGGTTPTYSGTVGDATNNAQFTLEGTAPALLFSETDATDPADRWRILAANNDLYLDFVDDSAATNVDTLRVATPDYVLHTGVYGSGAGAVIIATDSSTTNTALTTAGTNYLTAAITTGGPAYVEGHWQVELERTSAASVSRAKIFVRDDGVNLLSAFNHGSTNTGIADIIPAANDIHTFSGSFWVRHTATDTSTYQLFLSADDASRFEVNRGHLFVRSTQYPT